MRARHVGTKKGSRMKKLFLGGILSAFILLGTACGHQSTSSTPTASTGTTTALPTTTTTATVSVTTTAKTTTATMVAKTTTTLTTPTSSTTTTPKTVKWTSGMSNTSTKNTTRLNAKDFLPNVYMRLEKTVYPLDAIVTVEIENRTGGKISRQNRYLILKAGENDEWEIVVAPRSIHDYGKTVLLEDGIYTSSVDLSRYPLEAGFSYKLIVQIENKWVGADFRTAE